MAKPDRGDSISGRARRALDEVGGVVSDALQDASQDANRARIELSHQTRRLSDEGRNLGCWIGVAIISAIAAGAGAVILYNLFNKP